MRSVYEACFYGGLILAILLLILAIVLFIALKIPRVFDELTGRAAKKAMQGKKEGKEARDSISKQEQKKYYNQSTGKITIRQSVATKPATEDMADLDDEEATDVLTWSGDKVVSGSEVRAGFNPEVTEVLAEAKPKKNKKNKAPTEFLATQLDDEATDVLTKETDDDEATDVLKTEASDEATDVLTKETDDDEATDVLKTEASDEATDVLKTQDEDDEEATSVLKSEEIDEDATSVLIEADYVKLSRKVKVLYNVIVVHTDEKL